MNRNFDRKGQRNYKEEINRNQGIMDTEFAEESELFDEDNFRENNERKNERRNNKIKITDK